MRKWEDIVKDKLGGYESNLPEDSLAAFHARRATAGATKAKRFPLCDGTADCTGGSDKSGSAHAEG